MAPKKELPAVTPATVAAGLAAAEPAQKHTALAQLAAANFNNPQALADVVQQGIPGTLVELLQHSSDKSVKLLACRQLAVYAAAGPGHPLQQAVALVQTTQVLWRVLQSYAESEAAIKAVLADPAALRAAAAPKKLPGAKDPADPDEGLPGPSKFLLDAALRALSSLAACSTATAAAAAAEPAVGTSTASAPEQQQQQQQQQQRLQQQQQPWIWLSAQESLPVVCLLPHTSSRVQMRALRLTLQLARSDLWCTRFTAAGGVASAVHLASVLGGGSDISTGSTAGAAAAAVQLSALQLLGRLVKVSHTAAAAVLASRRQVLEGLMAAMLAAGSLRPSTPAAGGAKVRAAAGADAAKQGVAVRDTAVLVQQAADDLLSLLCATDSQTSQLLLRGNGLTALTLMMPDPPPAAGTVDSEPESAPPQQPQQQADSGTSSSVPCHAAQGDDRAGGARVAAAVPALSLTADADADSAGGGVGPQSPRRQKGGTPRSRHATPAGRQTADALPPAAAAATSFTAPGTKLYNPQLQAKLLHVIAAVLSVPDTVKPVLDACPQLPRLLLHMFAAPPGPPADDPAFAAVAGASSGRGAAVPADAAAAAKEAPGTGAVGAAAAKSGAQTPRGSVAVGVKVAAASGVQGSGSGAATPGKTVAAAGAAVKAPEPAANDPLGPPYATCVKLAALACLRRLVHHKPAAVLLASQQAAAAAASPVLAADSPPATARQRACEPQQQEEGRSGYSMLRQVLVSIQALGTDSSTAAAEQNGDAAGSSSSSSDGSSAADAETDARQQQQQPPVTASLDDAASFIEGLVTHLEEQQLLELPLVATLQVLAKCASQHAAAHHLQEAVMRALLSLPEDAFAAPPRPPLPSPPPTPPPPPLPSSLFAWDALDRPCVTDGAMVVSTHA